MTIAAIIVFGLIGIIGGIGMIPGDNFSKTAQTRCFIVTVVCLACILGITLLGGGR